ncbi:hypothetical protein [Acinetobacter gerneri]|uniref:hypothetical protein n=1 Tax=Acinetobacter gerneri TaxID=202952 RepID=UPI003215A9E8
MMREIYKIIAFLTLCLLLGRGAVVHAAPQTFNVFSKCTDENEFECKIYSDLNGKKSVVLDYAKSPMIKRINPELFYMKSSCGSPCQIHLFIAPNKEDGTQELIAFDPKSNCLIESDSEKKQIIARKLFSKQKKVIANLKAKEFSVLPSGVSVYRFFKDESKFDDHSNFTLILDDFDRPLVTKKITQPCRI